MLPKSLFGDTFVSAHTFLQDDHRNPLFTEYVSRFPPSQAALSQGGFNEDEGVGASTLTEANVASVFHHILKEQHEGLDQPANKRGLKCLEQI